MTAGFVVAAWLLGCLMAGSASASTSSGHIATDADDHSTSESGGLLGGLLGGVGDVVDGLTQTVTGPEVDDHGSGPDETSDADTGSVGALPDLLPAITSGSGTASTAPVETEQPSRTTVSTSDKTPATATAEPARKAQAERPHPSAPKRTVVKTEDKKTGKPAPVDGSRQAKEPLPPAPPAPQAPPAPTTAVGAGHDTTAHGKYLYAVTARDAVLAPPTATGTAIDHRATAVDRHRDRPAAAPD